MCHGMNLPQRYAWRRRSFFPQIEFTHEQARAHGIHYDRKGLRTAFHAGGFVDYDDMYEYSEDINNRLNLPPIGLN